MDPILVKDLIMKESEALYKQGKSIVFSGSPRLLPEAEAEIPAFKEWYPGRVFVFLLEIKNETTIERNTKRRICSGCGKIFTLGEHMQDACDACGGTLIIRPDDEPDVIRKRLALYHSEIEPVIEYFRRAGLPILNIDGERDKKAVFQSLTAELEKILS